MDSLGAKVFYSSCVRESAAFSGAHLYQTVIPVNQRSPQLHAVSIQELTEEKPH